MPILLTRDLIASVVDAPGGYTLSWDTELFAPAFVEPIRSRGFITRLEVLKIGRWKAVRATSSMQAPDARVRMVSAAA
ncbi:MAG: hypothetical protein Q8K89_01190, partial [Actinomycetota bacterium]|nr:hypothetical protein [Actinomycetota bacterium]